MKSKKKNITGFGLAPVCALLLCILPFAAAAQKKFTISGYVKAEDTGESFFGVNVYVLELLKGTPTNQYGFYSITVPEGEYTLMATFLGYQDFSQQIQLHTDIRMNISLQPKAIVFEQEVNIIDEKPKDNTQSTVMGKMELDMEKIKQLPSFMGEVDILKTIQFLPGVQSAGEGNSGFYVRGGGPDQNLILLDEAVVYNASHLFGFFSVFNADAIKSIELTKGGMPANYGGRLASVLDVSMKEGNSKKVQVDGGIGLIASRLTIQGPIRQDTSSFIISGRRTYVDIVAEPFIPDTARAKGSSYYFYDLNMKVNYRLSDKNRLFLSGYFGRDRFNYKNSKSDFDVTVPWGNATASARWNHLFSDKLFLNTTAIFSDYQFEFGAIQDEFEFKLFSGIKDGHLKFDFNYYPSPRHDVKFGTNYIYHTFTPSNVTAKAGDIEFDTGEIKKMYANEGAVYINDDIEVTPRLKLNAGLRYSVFQHIGPFDRYLKDEFQRTTDTLRFEAFENVKLYGGLEPRVSVRYMVNEVSSVKASITQNYQYLHLASISAVSLPTDVWLPSSDVVKPQLGTQHAFGYFRNFAEDKFESSVEVYFKEMKNIVEYKEGAAPENNINDNADAQLTFGTGTSYGAEFFLKKRTGDMTGWIGYTWAKTTRYFENLNKGNPFPAKYDRRHDLSIIWSYDVSDRLNFSAAFVYATGNTITLPIQRYIIDGRIVNEYGDRNGYRMIPYHRADISATIKGKNIKTITDPASGTEKQVARKWNTSWNFSIYNLYNRRNPYFIYFDNEGNYTQGTLNISAKQVSLFPILPSITWNFSF